MSGTTYLPARHRSRKGRTVTLVLSPKSVDDVRCGARFTERLSPMTRAPVASEACRGSTYFHV